MLNVTSHYLTLCLLKASMINHVPPDIAASILYVEGGKPGSISENKNGSRDLGIMQINDKVWLSLVSEALFAGDRDKASYELIYNSCMNIKVGVWILAYNIRMSKGDIWEAVGRYHSGNKVLAKKYIDKVKHVNQKYFNNDLSYQW